MKNKNSLGKIHLAFHFLHMSSNSYPIIPSPSNCISSLFLLKTLLAYYLASKWLSMPGWWIVLYHKSLSPHTTFLSNLGAGHILWHSLYHSKGFSVSPLTLWAHLDKGYSIYFLLSLILHCCLWNLIICDANRDSINQTEFNVNGIHVFTGHNVPITIVLRALIKYINI